ncbi:MAG: 4-deoxy-4-formamido-L-arabinose-phosphoundecaprenol deformylase [Candidatus Brocadia sp. WS118]|nr:MAG: 4-deoxy-4-formamido-L-arabinose-phosphoundecaprenol deformylase [Candidatus Brocadia sp. WS118]
MEIDVTTKVGLRVDVDTFRGTRLGVPALCRLFDERAVKASFFFSVGPDNMGRHLWRLLRPAFLWKMLRTRAANLYGWDIIFRGTFCPGPIIGKKLPAQIRLAARGGHEIGLHAWDHQAWQAHINTMTTEDIRIVLRKGFDMLTDITGTPPICSAVPAWKCTDSVLLAKAEFPFVYNSDCRGSSIFRPVVDGKTLSQPQIPVTMPTYDEAIGKNGITPDNYNESMLSQVKPGGLNVLTIHAEVEGIACAMLFADFLEAAKERDISFVPLGELLKEAGHIASGMITKTPFPGREGWVSCQVDIRNEESLPAMTG